MFANLPVTALRTFESAARLRSFKLAAAELAVTPTAVSHQVKALEQRVGVALFERVPRGVRLTERGASLFAGVHGALLDIAQTLDALRPAPDTGALTVSTTHSFAALWLVPRLGRFHQAYPQYQLRLDASARPVDLLQDASVDVAIRYSQKRYPALIAACSLPESFGVYGAPVLAARLGGRAPAGKRPRWSRCAGAIRGCMTRAGGNGARWPACRAGASPPPSMPTRKNTTRCRRPSPARAWCWPARSWCPTASGWGAGATAARGPGAGRGLYRAVRAGARAASAGARLPGLAGARIRGLSRAPARGYHVGHCLRAARYPGRARSRRTRTVNRFKK